MQAAAPRPFWRHPKSFLKLILVGFLLVALPLIFALIYSAMSINKLSNQSTQAVYQAEQLAHGSRILVDQAVAMERSVRLSTILGDASLLEGYNQAHGKFIGIVSSLVALPLSVKQRQLLNDISLSESEIFKKVEHGRQSHADLKDWDVGFGPMLELAQAFLTQGDVPIEHEVEAMQSMASQARKMVFWQLLALIPFAIILALGFSLLISSPIRQIDEAISSIGRGDLLKAVKVKGPEDLRRLGESLDWMRLRLLALEEQKTLFIQHISHELKTPLASIREGADLLAGNIVGGLNEKQHHVAKILLANSVELQKRIEDLLNYSAIQTGESTPLWQKVDLRLILDTVLHDQYLAIMNKSLIVDLVCQDISIEGDAQKIRIMADNLLSNAVKYSPNEGRIVIRAEPSGSHVTLEVTDSGPGIDPADGEKIFEAFYQGRRRPQSHIKGTGLGLSIARAYAREHGGTIELAKNSASGACFRVTLPASRIAITS